MRPCIFKSDFLRSFAAAEDGAVTVDYVVGTAMAVGLGLAVTNAVSGGAVALANKISTAIQNVHVDYRPAASSSASGTSGGSTGASSDGSSDHEGQD